MLQLVFAVMMAAQDRSPDWAKLCWAASKTSADSTMKIAALGLAKADLAHNDALIAHLRICRGSAHENAGRLPEAMADYEFGAAEGARLRNDTISAHALVRRGELRYYRGEHNTAIDDLNQGYRLWTKIGDAEQQRNALNAIANLYADSRIGQYDKAIEYYRQLLVAHEAEKDSAEIASDYFNIASTRERQGKLEEALSNYRKALEIDQKRGDEDEVAYDRRAIGSLLYKMDRPAEALGITDLALAHYLKTGNEELAAFARLTRGIALRMLGRGTEALADLNSSRAQFAKSDNQRFLEKIDEERALAYASVGAWREAYQARSSQLALQKALTARSQDEQSAHLRAEFDAEKKEAENAALLRENASSARLRRLQWAVLALSAIVIAGLTFFVTRQIRSAGRLRITALTDDLTGLPNRRHLLLRAKEEFRAARVSNTTIGVLAVDVDHFKKINDTFGHAAGDEVLRRVAASLRATLRAGDHVGRVGGEEFLVLLPRAAKADVDDVGNRVRQGIEQIDFSDIHPAMKVTVSVGAAVSESTDADFEAISNRADSSLYVAKSEGRNRVAMAGK